MSDQEPDYSALTLRELQDVAAHIDRERFPDRWQRVQAAIARGGQQSAPVPASDPPKRGMNRRRATVFVAILGVLALATAIRIAIGLYETHFWRGPDVAFGDQHLKTAVALIELHRLRVGRYPDKLSDLQFTGDWDRIALDSVSYHPNAARTRYCVEVERGWIAKPRLSMPPEFWKGTGYDPSLCR